MKFLIKQLLLCIMGILLVVCRGMSQQSTESTFAKHFDKEHRPASIVISPDPEIHGFVHVDVSQIETDEYDFQIENAVGEVIFKEHFRDKTFNLYLNSLEEGSYLLKVVTKNYVYTKSFHKT